MNWTEHYKSIREILKEWNAGFEIKALYPLPQSGSGRIYFRAESTKNSSFIIAYNSDVEENMAFFSFTESLLEAGVNVPNIYFIHKSKTYYILEDLGDTTLFKYLVTNEFEQALPYYKQAIDNLIKAQVLGKDLIDFSVAYPIPEFNKQAILWDLNYFKYYFLKLIYIPFNEKKLEDAFQTFADFLVSTPHEYFMYRDFQSRNIMIKNQTTYLIDYQGGRKGALQYDLASLLYDSKANLSETERTTLYNYYLQTIKNYQSIDEKKFKDYFYAYALVRILQAFGAYGYRGIYEQKEHFLKSIPYAIKNLQKLLYEGQFNFGATYLFDVLHKLVNSDNWKKHAITEENTDKLTISITSFSYRSKLPMDNSGNGGGFVFDCRSLPNPGRIDKYKDLTGQSKEVKEYFETQKETITNYLDHVFALLSYATENYLERNFKHLSVYFGCTGGQHRSVYCAEQTKKFLEEKYGDKINITLNHSRL